MSSYIPIIVSAVIAIAGTAAGFLAQRRTARSQELNASIDQFQEKADAAEARADKAVERADQLQRRFDELWNQMQELRDNYRQQIDWRDRHIARLTAHIYSDSPGPPAPSKPEGIANP